MKELEKIKAEREAARVAKEQEEQEEEDVESTNQDVLRGNPLLNKESFSMKRRFFNIFDCVLSNCMILVLSGGTRMLCSKIRLATNQRK